MTYKHVYICVYNMCVCVYGQKEEKNRVYVHRTYIDV